ncbi:MAG: prolyl oligopeptidase family serine peptidase [Corynebacterium sp.]|nr:prolyl oligopeptidase family serine peptidase [Corynebacterium sp.]
MNLKKLVSTSVCAVAAAMLTTATITAPNALAQSSASGLSSNPELLRGLSSALSDAVHTNAGGQSTSSKQTVYVPGQGNRSYIVEVPQGYTAGISYPVVFGFSGAWHSAEQARGYMKMAAVAGNDAIIVYPQGRGANGQGTWGGASYAETTRNQDVDFVRAIVNQLNATYTIDHSRIYATGLSNGGGMALALACQAPDVFAAVASVAGAFYNAAVDGCARGTVDTLIIHGTSDDIMHYEGGVGTGGPYRSVESVWSEYGRRNGCDTRYVPSQQGRSEVKTLNGCAAGGDTILYKVHGGTHTWFPSDPNATSTVWNFLRAR